MCDFLIVISYILDGADPEVEDKDGDRSGETVIQTKKEIRVYVPS